LAKVCIWYYALGCIKSSELEILIEKLIITKENQQAEAKRRGHGAEFQLALQLHNLNCQMIPEERYTKPIGFKDPNVDRKSFELPIRQKGRHGVSI